MAVGTDQAGAVCHGVLVVTMPSGKTLEIKTTFDSGSEVDAVSKTVATELKDMGCPWGEAGGGIAVADGSEVTPFGELRLMLTAEPRRREGQKAKANEFAIPRPLTFVTDAKIIDGLTSDLIIGWPTLKGTGLLAVVLGLEEYEPEEDHDADGLDDMWDDSTDPQYGMPEIKGKDRGEVEKLRELCQKWKHLFGAPQKGGSKLPPINIELKKDSDGNDMRPKRQPCRNVSPWIRELIKQDTQKRVELGWYRYPEPGEVLPYASPIVAAKQPSKGPDVRRICADYRQTNQCAEETRHPVKNQQAVLQRLKGKKRFCTFDLRKGFHQCRLTEFAAKLLAVITPDGLVIPITAPFGFHGLPAQFQYLVSKVVLEELDENGIESFIDDLNVNAHTFDEMYNLVEQLFVRLDKWDLRINGSKSVMNTDTCVYLGRYIDGEGRQHTESRLTGIAKMQRPYDKQQIKAFMGMVNYMREHLQMDFAALTFPINRMLRKDEKFEWTDECEQCFEDIKKRIMANQKLYWLDYDLPIFIRCDASKLGVGAQLFQLVDGKERTVSFISKTFSPAEANWSTLEQELFAAVWATKQWMSYLEGAHFTIQTDHENILQLHKSVAAKVVRWRLAMSMFSYNIVHVEGRDSRHAVADCLSRLHGPAYTRVLSTVAMTTRAQSLKTKALLGNNNKKDLETLALAKISDKDDSEDTSRKGFMHADSGPIGGAYRADF